MADGENTGTTAQQFREVFELAKAGVTFLCFCSSTLQELVSVLLIMCNI